ncbi:MAG: maleylacetate reductase [Pseudolabrys sp.]
MPERFDYLTPKTRIVFGNGRVRELPAEVRRVNMSRVLVLCSKGRKELATSISAGLGEASAGICDEALPNMPRAAFDVVMQTLAARKADGFVAVGGGSSVGLAKAVSVASQVPFIAVVTTLSGSEMSQKWALGRGLGRAGGNDERALPVAVIYDPELVAGLPPHVVAASGLNAIAHAVESLYGRETNPVVQTLCEEAIGRLSKSLPKIIAGPGSVDDCNEALYGAWLAGTFRATIAIHHVIAQQVRQLFDLDHAKTHAVVLPYALAFNAPAIPHVMGRLQRALGAAHPSQALFDLNVQLGLPTSLVELGMSKDQLPDAVDVVMQVACHNPRPFSRSDVAAILDQALAGQRPDA